ncbi:MAG: SDR family oxidoreductase [Hyphomonadaceae bacterium]|nr:SDR family oxidoreductase [Hyphomonadaceae bacterium]
MDHPTTVVAGLGLEVGVAVARRFFDSGHNVVVGDGDERRIRSAREDLPEKIEVLNEPIAQFTGMHNCFARAENKFGRLDHLVLIPQILAKDSLDELDLDQFARDVSTNLRSLVMAIRGFAQRVANLEEDVEARAEQRHQRGSVTVILSLAARMSQPGQYTATILQGAAETIVRASALELASSNVRVNAIAALRPRAEKREGSVLGLRTPMKRTASADEIAAATLFLAEDKAAIITGETLVMDGGRGLLSGLMKS